MSSTSKIAVVAGVSFGVAAVAAIVRLVLYQPVLKHPGYILGPGAGARVSLGAFSAVIPAISLIGAAVTCSPAPPRPPAAARQA
jgi:hypothetical protein